MFCVQPDGSGLGFRFHSDCDQDDDDFLGDVWYDLDENDQLKFRSPEAATFESIFMLQILREIILFGVLTHEGTLTFDLNSRRVSNPIPGLLRTCQEYLALAERTVYRSYNTLIAQMTVTKPIFNRSKLEFLSNRDLNGLPRWFVDPWGQFSETTDGRVIFDLPAGSRLKIIRFEAIRLFEGFGYMTDSSMSSFPLRQDQALHIQIKATKENRCLNMDDIRRRFLAFTLDICTRRLDLCHLRLGSVWMDGEGRMVGVHLMNEAEALSTAITDEDCSGDLTVEEDIKIYYNLILSMQQKQEGGFIISDIAHLAKHIPGYKSVAENRHDGSYESTYGRGDRMPWYLGNGGKLSVNYKSAIVLTPRLSSFRYVP